MTSSSIRRAVRFCRTGSRLIGCLPNPAPHVAAPREPVEPRPIMRGGHLQITASHSLVCCFCRVMSKRSCWGRNSPKTPKPTKKPGQRKKETPREGSFKTGLRVSRSAACRLRTQRRTVRDGSRLFVATYISEGRLSCVRCHI